MSTPQILEDGEPHSLGETAAPNDETPLELFRRFSSDVPDDDALLLQAVNDPMTHQNCWDELLPLRDEGAWNEERNAEILLINEDREGANVRRLSAAMRLAFMRGVSFDALWQELVLSRRSCSINGE